LTRNIGLVSATIGIDRLIIDSRRNDRLSAQRRKNTVSAVVQGPRDDRRAPRRWRDMSFSQGAEWKALISTYIRTIPLNGDP
jgi:hypothetical protein